MRQACRCENNLASPHPVQSRRLSLYVINYFYAKSRGLKFEHMCWTTGRSTWCIIPSYRKFLQIHFFVHRVDDKALYLETELQSLVFCKQLYCTKNRKTEPLLRWAGRGSTPWQNQQVLNQRFHLRVLSFSEYSNVLYTTSRILRSKRNHRTFTSSGKDSRYTLRHKVHNTKYTVPSSEIGTPTPSPTSECVPPRNHTGRDTLACGWGGVGAPIRTTGEKA